MLDSDFPSIKEVPKSVRSRGLWTGRVVEVADNDSILVSLSARTLEMRSQRDHTTKSTIAQGVNW